MSEDLQSQPIVVVVDTCIFIEAVGIESIDWLGLTGATSVQLVVVAQVVKELDKLKDQGPKRKRDRARAATRLCWEARSGPRPIRENVLFSVHMAEPSTFPPGFDSAVPDNRIVASALDLQEARFVSLDVAALLKAESSGLRSIQLPGKYLPPERPDPLEEENQSLRKEIRDLKNREPRLTVEFSNGEMKPHRVKAGPLSLVPDTVPTEPSNAMLPPMEVPSSSHTTKGGFPNLKRQMQHLNPILRPSAADVRRYNAAVNRYNEDYSAAFREFVEVMQQLPEFVALEFVLLNSGRGPAEGIEITLILEEKAAKSWSFTHPHELPAFPDFPEAPQRPRAQSDLGRIIADLHVPSFHIDPPAPEPQSGLDVVDQQRAVLYSTRLSHHSRCSYPTVYVRRTDASRGFQLRYEIHADNIPELGSGTLQVVVDDPNWLTEG